MLLVENGNERSFEVPVGVLAKGRVGHAKHVLVFVNCTGDYCVKLGIVEEDGCCCHLE